jgi:hypothetical protein
VGLGRSRPRPSLLSSCQGLLPSDVLTHSIATRLTYDLRRLRRKHFIQRIPHTQRYALTSEGRRLAVFLTKTYTRIANPSLAELDPSLPADIAQRTPLARAWRAFEHALQDRINEAGTAA